MTWELVLGVMGAVTGVSGTTAAITAIVVQRRDSRGAGKVADKQAADIQRLVEIEERRAAKEADQERRTLEEAEAAAQVLLVGALTVRVPSWAMNQHRYLWLANDGPCEAEVVSAVIRSGEPGGASERQQWDQVRDTRLEAGEGYELPLYAFGFGPASVDLRWRDGREGEQSRTVDIEIPPR